MGGIYTIRRSISYALRSHITRTPLLLSLILLKRGNANEEVEF